ncbi:hypothetical protein CHS0354_020015 [Potamilus streckersoni]|uniref:Uncharacterized protein n=1 Tax=Potamilus streckersoni TaxID=2493646 RepID=A0AAE0S6L0_9BIVA|nr:hypothetical protein CHS0354_020015 [Potamilus streckersoni]
MGNKLDKVIPEDEQQTKSVPTPTGCAYCSEKVRLVSFKQLQPGAHICQGGQNSMLYMNRNQKCLYTHHAIVKNVNCSTETDTKAYITFIHYYSTPYDAEVKIRETREERDLLIHEMYIVRYRYARFQPDQVLERAQKVLDDDPA